MRTLIVCIMLAAASCANALAGHPGGTDELSDSSTVERKGLSRWWNSLVHGNVDRTREKKVDMSFIVAPCYTREGSFGVGGAATALYRLDRNDMTMQPSDFSLSGSATIKGFYSIAAKGNNHFKGNKARLTYRLSFQHRNLEFWGISRAACGINPISEYTKQLISWETDYVYKLTKDFHIGAAFNIKYTKASAMTSPDYLEGQKSSYFFSGIGISLQYDTRDFILNPKRGVYVMLREVVYPEFSGSHDRTIFGTTAMFDVYQLLWKGSVLAFDLYGQFYNGDVPWTLREELGSGTSRMRGYYAGRYIDNNQISAQLELRQHFSGRVGGVVWAGGGTVFPSIAALTFKSILPNYGLGLRIEFKHNVNIRIDYGFGKDTGGFVFQFAEAF